MADVKASFTFTVTFTQKEFSVITRMMAGHEMKGTDLELLRELNLNLVKQRTQQVQQFVAQCEHAESIAEREMKTERESRQESRRYDDKA